MSGFASWFSWGSDSNSAEMPNIFPLSIEQASFVKIDVLTIYRKILTDVLERSQGLTDDEQALLWDNCLASESAAGLVTMLACAMSERAELFLVYDKAIPLIRKATDTEKEQIKADYKVKAESSAGVYISFKNYEVADMIRLYSGVEYCSVGALYKGMNVSKALQLKIHDLRASTGLIDKAEVKAQALAMAKGLGEGKDIMSDAKDVIELAKPDLTATTSSMELTNQKRSFYLNLPASYITGVLNGGLGDSGQADAKAIERGLKGYFYSIIKPACKAIFAKDLEFKSDDFMQLATALEALKTFDVTSDAHMSAENKTGVINKLFGFDPEEKGDETKPEPTPTTPPKDPPAKPPEPGA